MALASKSKRVIELTLRVLADEGQNKPLRYDTFSERVMKEDPSVTQSEIDREVKDPKRPLQKKGLIQFKGKHYLGTDYDTVEINEKGLLESAASDEAKLYPRVQDALQAYFSPKSLRCKFEVTAEGISNEFQETLRNELLFLIGSRELRPDILGRVEYPVNASPFYYFEFFVTAEVKIGAPTINDLFQAKKYGEVYQAAIAMLVSTQKPETRLLRLLENDRVLLHLSSHMHMAYLCRLSEKDNIIDWWFPEEPRTR